MINVNVEKQRAEFVNVDFETVENSENLYSIQFTFSADWNGFKRYAVFKNLSCCHEVQKEINEDNTVLIPNEIFKTSGILKVGVFGYSEDVFKPTLYTENAVLIKKGVNVNADNPHDFEPSEFLKLLQSINTVKKDLSEHVNNFENPHNVLKSQIGLSNVENLSPIGILRTNIFNGRNYLTKGYEENTFTGDDSTFNFYNINFVNLDIANELRGVRCCLSLEYENNITSGYVEIRNQLTYGVLNTFNATNTGKGMIYVDFTVADREHTNTRAVYLTGKFLGTLKIKNVKIEYGRVPTGFSIAPEDLLTALGLSTESTAPQISVNMGEVNIPSVL